MIRIGIAGYGNLGRGVECAVKANPDCVLAGIFTRRDPAGLRPLTQGVPVWSQAEAAAHTQDIDVLILCGGSATDLPEQTPQLAALYTVVDSFDNHAHIPAHFAAVNAAAKAAGKVAVISAGWDPGLFSLNRIFGESFLPDGAHYTFWGKGVSQGHSDAIRRIEGVQDARQYTVPVEEALERVRSGEQPRFTAREMHRRECYVVAKEGADLARIEREIVTMPDYFAPYDTTVHFISQEELNRSHAGIPHGGFVLRGGKLGWNGERRALIEYSLKLDSNPEFTSSVLVATARAAARLACEGQTGAKTLFDIPPAYYSPKSGEELRATLL